MLDQTTELTTTELLKRGWTRTLIKRFLPRPDGCIPVNHYHNFRGQDTYATVKIWNVEQSKEFETAFVRSWKGRMKSVAPNHALKILRAEPPPIISDRTKEEIQRDSMLAKAAGIFMEARMRGYRTPHKC